jgi:hypothetical protein
LLKIVDEETDECPVCGTTGKKILAIITTKMEKLSEIKDNLFAGFNFDKTNKRHAEILNNIVKTVKSMDNKEILDYFLCNGNQDNRKLFEKAYKEISKLTNKIKKLLSVKEEQYKVLKAEETLIKGYINKKFDFKEIIFDDENYQIEFIPKKGRKIDSYSTGEINLLLIIVKLYGFRINNKDILVIDDPISSFDMTNQYKIMYEIASLTKENKVHVFTHNIETINILNSQLKWLFNLKYFDVYKGVRYIKKISTSDYGILNIIKKYDKDKYLLLLVSRELEDKNYKGHKVFHYDSPFTFRFKVGSDYVDLTNEYFVEMIDSFDASDYIEKNFEEMIYIKILLIIGIRVWIEKKFYEAFKDNKDILCELTKKETFGAKIDYLYPKGKTPKINCYPEVDRTKLMQMKVMLNQNGHYYDQIQPFNFAANVSIDDLDYEICIIKKMFEYKKESA